MTAVDKQTIAEVITEAEQALARTHDLVAQVTELGRKERALEGAALPAVDSEWVWEPLREQARERVRVVEVRWNGEAWWVGSVAVTPGRAPDTHVYWNELDRWVEATVAAPDNRRTT